MRFELRTLASLAPYGGPATGSPRAAGDATAVLSAADSSRPILARLRPSPGACRAFPFCRPRSYVLHLRHMSKTVTIRLTRELATWLEQASKQSGIPKGRIVREQLEKARDGGKEPSFMRLAGSVRGVRDLSTRKGFSRS